MSQLNEKVKSELGEFVEVLEKVFTPPDLRAPNDLLFDSGLVIFEDSSEINTEQIINCLPEGKGRFFLLDKEYDDYGFLEELIAANEKDQWLVVDCKVDPSPQIISILKQISNRNYLTVPYFKDQELFSLKINHKTRIIFCVCSDFLEKGITYPSFINLFGPVIRI